MKEVNLKKGRTENGIGQFANCYLAYCQIDSENISGDSSFGMPNERYRIITNQTKI